MDCNLVCIGFSSESRIAILYDQISGWPSASCLLNAIKICNGCYWSDVRLQTYQRFQTTHCAICSHDQKAFFSSDQHYYFQPFFKFRAGNRYYHCFYHCCPWVSDWSGSWRRVLIPENRSCSTWALVIRYQLHNLNRLRKCTPLAYAIVNNKELIII